MSHFSSNGACEEKTQSRTLSIASPLGHHIIELWSPRPGASLSQGEVVKLSPQENGEPQRVLVCQKMRVDFTPEHVADHSCLLIKRKF